jgi:hypothetical protein
MHLQKPGLGSYLDWPVRTVSSGAVVKTKPNQTFLVYLEVCLQSINSRLAFWKMKHPRHGHSIFWNNLASFFFFPWYSMGTLIAYQSSITGKKKIDDKLVWFFYAQQCPQWNVWFTICLMLHVLRNGQSPHHST